MGKIAGTAAVHAAKRRAVQDKRKEAGAEGDEDEGEEAIHLASDELTDAQYNELYDLFVKFDKDSSGFLDDIEMRQALRLMGVATSQAEEDRLMASVDVNGDGQTDWDEFLEFSAELLNDATRTEAELEMAFAVLASHCRAPDPYPDPRIMWREEVPLDVELLTQLLTSAGNPPFSAKEAKELIAALDPDGTGRIHMGDFVRLPCWETHHITRPRAPRQHGFLPALPSNVVHDDVHTLDAGDYRSHRSLRTGSYDGKPRFEPTAKADDAWWAPAFAVLDGQSVHSSPALPPPQQPPPRSSPPPRLPPPLKQLSPPLPASRSRPQTPLPPLPQSGPARIPKQPLVPEPMVEEQPPFYAPDLPPHMASLGLARASAPSSTGSPTMAARSKMPAAPMSAPHNQYDMDATVAVAPRQRLPPTIESIPNTNTQMVRSRGHAAQPHQPALDQNSLRPAYPVSQPGHAMMQPSGVTGLTAVPVTAPPQQVMSHAVFEVAQTRLEAVQEVAQAKLQLAQAKLAVVSAHVGPSEGTWVGNVLESFASIWRPPQEGDPDRSLYA